MNPIDATALAIFFYEGANQGRPTTRNVRNLNPGNLRPVHGAAVPIDSGNYRIFNSFADGWNALTSDITYKLNHHLQPADTMVVFFELYAPGADHNDPNSYAQYVCRWLSQALGKQVTCDTGVKDIYEVA